MDNTKVLEERIRHLEQKLRLQEVQFGRLAQSVFNNADILNLRDMNALKGIVASLPTTYAPIAKGVTNGDSHDHSGGDGAQIDHGGLAGLADDDHTQYLNTTRHDTTTRHPFGSVIPHDSHSKLVDLTADDHTQYLNTTRHDTTTRHTLGTVVPHDDHGLLSGLTDDDHTQYVKKAASSTDNAIARFDGTTGRLLQNSMPTISDAGYIMMAGYEIGIWSSWTPASYTGWSSLPTGTYRYCVIGKLLIFNIDMTAGTSNGTNARIKLPITVANNQDFGGACGLAYDNGVLLTGAARWYVSKNTDEVIFQKDMGTGAWTASGTKRIRCLGFAEV
jgi:hypothetical protein